MHENKDTFHLCEKGLLEKVFVWRFSHEKCCGSKWSKNVLDHVVTAWKVYRNCHCVISPLFLKKYFNEIQFWMLVSLCSVLYANMNMLPNKIIMMILCIYVNLKKNHLLLQINKYKRGECYKKAGRSWETTRSR